MKKLALVLAASALAVGSASANISTGFYLGSALGYGATVGKFTDNTVTGSADVGSGSGNIGVHVGYGWVTNCVYWGGELAYTFENARVNNTFEQATGTDSVILKRSGYFGAALRGGYLFTPNTMMYIRLGGNWSNWKLKDTLRGNFNLTNQGNGSKNRMSFVPGFGMETAVHKHVYVRIEYTYEFGPGVMAANPSVVGSTQVGNIRAQTGKVGLSYKF
jgi:opacity protein-like surface antigen